MTTVPFTMLAGTSYAIAASAKRHNEQRMHTAMPMLIGAACFTCVVLTYLTTYLAVARPNSPLCRLLPWALSTLGPIVAFSLLAIGVCTAFTVHAPLLAWCASFLKGPSASTGLAVIKVMAGLGAFTGPAAIGIIRQHHPLAYAAALWFVSITLVAAAGLCLGACVGAYQ